MSEPRLSAELQRTVTEGSEELTSSIDNIELPYESRLLQYANATPPYVASFATSIYDMLDLLRSMTITAPTLLFNPDDYDDAYTETLLSTLSNVISGYLAAGGTGLDAAVEDAQFNRAREKAIAIGNRGLKKVQIELAKRIPYAGMLADIYRDFETDYKGTVSEMNRDITIKQAELAWQQKRAIIAESFQSEKRHFDIFQDRVNNKEKINQTYDTLNMQNNWTYFETLIKKYIGYAQQAISYLAKPNSEDQQSFENFARMAEMMANGQLRIVGAINNLQPGQSL